MRQRLEMLAHYRASCGEFCVRTEHRNIETSTRPRRLNFAEPQPAETRSLPGTLVLALTTAYTLLADWQECNDPQVATLGSWQRYLALPRRTATEKYMAEVFRILRVFRCAAIQRNGHIEIREDGLIRARCDYERCALNLLTTQTGLELLLSCVAYYLESFDQPFPEAYVESMIGQYYADIVGEIRAFADNDRILFQFRQKRWFNRHVRLDCANPQLRRDGEGEGERYFVEAGKYGADAARYPIDFYITHNDKLYIVPAEALRDGAIRTAELPVWCARTVDGQTLPDAFRLRFACEKNIVGLPMT
ncbi:hypothetical protein [Plasticicumulans acidivorans]|uniref:Uncharacterized protein n=1 Tax=Plasticicumulans acidivorans TaxID=886464 RepID=A0A317MTN1_9GAMM|nr:hypothetical protein [Plasticicumulans acidivorans]PWV60994.1 hypothetical protein C7443_1068 [Plasticicumulans acidivorans]